MVAKIRTIQVQPDTIEPGVAYLRDVMLPAVRDLDGFRGMVALLDREGERAVTLTLWDDEEALQASEDIGARKRSGGGAPPAPASVERFEVALAEIPGAVALRPEASTFR